MEEEMVENPAGHQEDRAGMKVVLSRYIDSDSERKEQIDDEREEVLNIDTFQAESLIRTWLAQAAEEQKIKSQVVETSFDEMAGTTQELQKQEPTSFREFLAQKFPNELAKYCAEPSKYEVTVSATGLDLRGTNFTNIVFRVNLTACNIEDAKLHAAHFPKKVEDCSFRFSIGSLVHFSEVVNCNFDNSILYYASYFSVEKGCSFKNALLVGVLGKIEMDPKMFSGAILLQSKCSAALNNEDIAKYKIMTSDQGFKMGFPLGSATNRSNFAKHVNALLKPDSANGFRHFITSNNLRLVAFVLKSAPQTRGVYEAEEAKLYKQLLESFPTLCRVSFDGLGYDKFEQAKHCVRFIRLLNVNDSTQSVNFRALKTVLLHETKAPALSDEDIVELIIVFSNSKTLKSTNEEFIQMILTCLDLPKEVSIKYNEAEMQLIKASRKIETLISADISSPSMKQEETSKGSQI